MSNIISAGNLSVSGNMTINADNTKSNIINGLTTFNNNIVCNNNISCANLTTNDASINSSNITNTDTINTKFLQLSASIYLTSVFNNVMELRSINAIKMYINNVLKCTLDSDKLETYSFNSTFGSIITFTSTTINNIGELATSSLKFLNGVVLNAYTQDGYNGLIINSQNAIKMYINNVIKFTLDADKLETFNFNSTFGSINTFTSTTINNMTEIATGSLKFLNGVFLNAYTQDGYNGLNVNSQIDTIFKINSVEKCRINNTGITTPILNSTTGNIDNINSTGTITCNNLILTTLNTTNVNATNDVNATNLCRGKAFQLNYSTGQKPYYNQNNMGSINDLGSGIVYVNDANLHSSLSFWGSGIDFPVGNWMFVLIYQVQQQYNFSNCVFQFNLVNGSSQENLFGSSKFEYVSGPYNIYHGSATFFQYNDTTINKYVTYKIISNNYTNCFVHIRLYYIRLS